MTLPISKGHARSAITPLLCACAIACGGAHNEARPPALDRSSEAVRTAPAQASTEASTQGSAQVAARRDTGDTTSLRKLSKQRVIAVAAAVLGIAGAGVGTVYRSRAKDANDDAAAYCTSNNHCDGRALALRDDARTANRIATTAFIVWGVGLGGGALLYFTAPEAKQKVPQVGLGLTSVSVGGVW